MKKFLLIMVLFLGFSRQGFAINDETVLEERENYYKTLRSWSHVKNNVFFQHLETTFIWHSTFKSEVFRQAFESYFKKLYLEGQEGLATELAQHWMNSSSQSEFFVSLYAAAKGMDNLEGPKSLWDLNLNVGGQLYKPLSIEVLKLSPFYGKFFPYIDRWDRLYRVVFPVDPETLAHQTFSLQLYSIAGASEMKFKVPK